MTDLTTPVGYADFVNEIKQQIRQRQYQALRAANKELLALYWWMGETISRRQTEQGWGKAVVESLAHDLQAAFPGRNGFSARNLWNMLDFYRAYADKPKLQPLVAEISWAKNLLIMARCKDDLEREFYLRATARFGWTKNVLQHQIDNQSYRQYLAGQTNFDAAVPESIRAQALLAVKDHYTFDFLGLADEHSERELEQALIRHLRAFLTEMGESFTFVANQYRLEVDGKDYFIDLLLFHRRLRCLVAIELKIGSFKPEHKGQIEFYLDQLDQHHRFDGENPPIGIVICRDKTRTVVEYAMRNMNRPLGIATYTVTPQLPADYRHDLPSPEQIAARLQAWAVGQGEDE
ncbi:PDDEXK nuclease domain-containing protein [Methylococcus sp. ANG]|uniref:PDDEXK nuclease domain-containing protein n=1 Tax=Methylococcus sp. ANG TaxID=3231903 RepID=UPI00345AF5FB